MVSLEKVCEQWVSVSASKRHLAKYLQPAPELGNFFKICYLRVLLDTHPFFVPTSHSLRACIDSF
jgi:hypothetical protein